MKDSEGQQASVLLAGLGHAGVKMVIAARQQFEYPGYAYVGVDSSNELINLEEGLLTDVLTIEQGWDGEPLENALKGLEMIVLLFGLAGKTAGHAAKAILQAANKMKIPVMILATTPFNFEGPQRQDLAASTIVALQKKANALVKIPNDLLLDDVQQEIPLRVAFERSDAWMAEIATSLLKPFTSENLFNIRKENLSWLLEKRGAVCLVAMGFGEGEDAIQYAIDSLIRSPFLSAVKAVDAALVMVTLPEDASVAFARKCLSQIRERFLPQMQVEIGLCQDDTIAEGVRIVTLIRQQTGLVADESPHDGSEPAAESSEAAPVAVKKSKAASAMAAKARNDRQITLDLPDLPTGIFRKNEPTHGGAFVNLDVPTYLRESVEIEPIITL